MYSPTADVRRSSSRCRPIGVLAGIVCLALVSQSRAQNTDGWGSDGGPGTIAGGASYNTTYSSQSTFGVTLGSNALMTTTPQGSFWGPSTPNMMTNFYTALRDAKFIQYDLTLINQQL